ncbi:MAG: SRPBCC family protein [Acidobacteriota bacterium]
MRVWELRTRIRLPRPRPEVFGFFSDAANLEQLTPPWLRFRILTPPPIAMQQGARIDYRIRLRGLPVGWKTEITAWEPPRRFVDEQLRGPYRLWVHEHGFEEIEGGTLATDFVRYAAPGGVLSLLINRLLVARDLRTVFRYRHRKLREIFGAWPGDDEDGVTIS